MRRFLLTLAVLGSFSAVPGASWAQDFWDRVDLDRKRMACWPQPFNLDDRELVRRPLFAMVNRGWQLQNTLSDHFFHAEDQSLTKAGEFKLRWILTQAPAHRRTVFVLRPTNAALTGDRLAAVRRHAEKITDTGSQANVLVSDMAPAGGSGEYFDQVDRQLKASVPEPRLPERAGPTSLGGG